MICDRKALRLVNLYHLPSECVGTKFVASSSQSQIEINATVERSDVVLESFRGDAKIYDWH